MSGQFVRLKDSERNALIENYRNGIVDPNYEVIPSKTTTGKYTIRRRKVSLPVEEHTEEPQQEPAEEQEQHVEVAEEQDPYTNDAMFYPGYKLNKNAMFREMQMQMNRMFIEQMKMMRQQVKYAEKKREKMKTKSKRISDMLTNIVEQAQREDAEEEHNEEVTEEVAEEKIEEPAEEKPVSQEQSFSATDRINAMIASERQYKNDYERNLDHMAGDVYRTTTSRRNRLNTDKFGI